MTSARGQTVLRDTDLEMQTDGPNGGAYIRCAIYDDNSGEVGTLQTQLSTTHTLK